MGLSVFISEEDVALGLLNGDLDVCATLTVLLYDESNLDRVCRGISEMAGASTAECTIPGRLRYVADALEQTQSDIQ